MEDENAEQYVGGDSDDENTGVTINNTEVNKGKKTKEAILIGDEDIEEQLEEDYVRYLRGSSKSNKNIFDPTLPETASMKRKRLSNTAESILRRKKYEENEIENELLSSSGIDNSVKQYANMLAGMFSLLHLAV